jgi:CDP-glycerol glycerophosphotransferase (TagB/SpsB family)
MDKILSDFLEFERDEGLFGRKYKGVYYWQYVRHMVGKKSILFKTKATTGDQVIRKKNYPNEIVSLLKQSLCDLRKGLILKNSELLYFDQQASRYIDGKQVDPYFDFWELDRRFSIQKCYYREVNESKVRGRDEGIGVAFAELMQGIVYHLSKIVPGIFADEKEDRFIRDLCVKVHDRYNVMIPKKRMIQIIRDTVIRHRIYGIYYYRLIKKVNPKVIIVVCHFDSKLFPLYEVSHKCGVPVIELEHGLVSNHDAYNYKDLTSEGKILPDFFFMYGDFWKQYIQLPVCMQPVAVGNPFLESQRLKYQNIIPDEKTIVFYSDEIGIEEAQLVIEFYKRNADNGYRVCFKPHPREYPHMRELYSIFDEYPEIQIIPQDMNLYELLAGAKHHVAAVSTVLFEAAIFDVKRYVLYRPEWIQYIQPLLDIGLAKLFYNLDQLQELLAEEENVDKSMLDFIWKRNARENALKALENIINGRKVD